MESRWYNGVIVLFWFSTMTWLVVDKVLPPLRRGDPPSYQTIYEGSETADPPVAWQMNWNNQPLGWAVSRVTRDSAGMTEVDSRVQFDKVPLEEMSPALLRAVVRSLVAPIGELEMQAHSRMEIDPLGRLAGFRSAVRVAGFPDSIVMHGTVEGSRLKIHVESGDVRYDTERYLPDDALIGDELSPLARLPGLHVGQSWTVPVYSPIRPPNSPMEILQAKVEDWEMIIWNGQAINTMAVIYRSDSGSGFGTLREPRGKLWVTDDGTVLRQEVNVFGSRLTFTRLYSQESLALADKIDELTLPRATREARAQDKRP